MPADVENSNATVHKPKRIAETSKIPTVKRHNWSLMHFYIIPLEVIRLLEFAQNHNRIKHWSRQGSWIDSL